jgi:D-alanyl-D-alanine dipeptidase
MDHLGAPRPWNPIPIHECDEPLVALPGTLHRLEPHPYAALGAPYGPGLDPYRLRQGVVSRLLEAQGLLQQEWPGRRLAIFDAWRPVAVQRFMVNHACDAECRRRGLDPGSDSPGRQQVQRDVARFWAPPSEDPHRPPPHSTGAAVDLTLIDLTAAPLEMGGEIDAIGPVSEPDHFRETARAAPNSAAGLWHGHRCCLRKVMEATGFAQHPHEWWHFSFGDQLWAWRRGMPRAIYGGREG